MDDNINLGAHERRVGLFWQLMSALFEILQIDVAYLK